MKCFVFINNCSATGSYLESNSSIHERICGRQRERREVVAHVSLQSLGALDVALPLVHVPVQRLDELRTTEVQRLIVRDGITIKCSL